MTNSPNILKAALAILLLGCLLDMPYAYFQLVRFIGMVGFGILAAGEYQKRQTWFIIWLCSAILINPIFKISLGREIWNVVDVIWAILLVASIFIPLAESKED
jgi:hypothetical protein